MPRDSCAWPDFSNAAVRYAKYVEEPLCEGQHAAANRATSEILLQTPCVWWACVVLRARMCARECHSVDENIRLWSWTVETNVCMRNCKNMQYLYMLLVVQKSAALQSAVLETCTRDASTKDLADISNLPSSSYVRPAYIYCTDERVFVCDALA